MSRVPAMGRARSLEATRAFELQPNARLRDLKETTLRIVTIIATLCCAFASTATASNAPHPTLDQVATEVAGKPVSVWCETNEFDWDSAIYKMTSGKLIGAAVNGFTFVGGSPIVYLSPRQCTTLRLALDYGYREVGVVYLASAVLTLVHEAVHQRGVLDEGVTDCTALPLVVPAMTKFFGLTPTVVSKEVKQTWVKVRRKIAGKWRTIRVRATTVGDAVVPNSDVARAQAWALAWHRSKPAEYQGGC